MQREYPGEPLTLALPADVKSVEFQGVEAYRIFGTEDQLKETTAILSSVYEKSEMTTVEDARWIGKSVDGEDLYILFVLRQR